MRLLALLLALLLAPTALTKSIVFPSGEEFHALDTSPSGFEDPLNTGSLVFAKNSANRRLSMGLPLTVWYDSAKHQFFRAHPALIECLAAVNSRLAREQTGRLQILRGFVPLAELGKEPPFPDNFHAAGSAAELQVRDSEKQRPLVTAVTRACALPLLARGVDFGLSVKASSLLLWLRDGQAGGDGGLEFRAEDTSEFASNEEVEKFARGQWEAEFGFGVNATELGCFNEPTDWTGEASAVVGPADVPVPRSLKSPDFRRLLQFPAEGVHFAECPRLVGSSERKKCDSRLMSPRMHEAMRLLLAVVKSERPQWSISVSEGWRQTDTASLLNEGRQLVLSVAGGTVDDLAGAAACSGFDFVQRQPSGDSLLVAVFKQRRLGDQPVVFQQASGLLPVQPPAATAEDYDVMGVDAALLEDMPLFDGALPPNTSLGEFAKLGDFVTSDHRYFRLDPGLPSCYDALVARVNRQRAGKRTVGVKILRAFTTEAEQQAAFDAVTDERAGQHPLGVALQLQFDSASAGFDAARHTPWLLAEEAAVACGPKFRDRRALIGIGVYTDSVFVDMRRAMKVWLECEASRHPGCQLRVPEMTGGFSSDPHGFKQRLTEVARQAIQGWMVEPLGGDENCRYDWPPRDQSPNFEYVERVERPDDSDSETHEQDAGQQAAQRLEQAAPASSSGSDCSDASEFCSLSKASREEIVGHLWRDISTKHLLAGEDSVKQSLHDCLRVCSGCRQGDAWRRKMRACSLLAHRIPFGLQRHPGDSQFHLYAADSQALRRLACYGRYCIDWSPLYSLLKPTLDATFRPNPERAGQEKIYDTEGNPSPLMAIVRRLFAHYASGETHVWLQDESDVRSMSEELKVLFLYNRRVTSVVVHVGGSVRAVSAALDSAMDDWAAQACPASSREYLTPHRVTAVVEDDEIRHSRRDGTSGSDDSEISAQVRISARPSIDATDLRHW